MAGAAMAALEASTAPPLLRNLRRVILAMTACLLMSRGSLLFLEPAARPTGAALRGGSRPQARRRSSKYATENTSPRPRPPRPWAGPACLSRPGRQLQQMPHSRRAAAPSQWYNERQDVRCVRRALGIG